jgi:hypothetical protein
VHRETFAFCTDRRSRVRVQPSLNAVRRCRAAWLTCPRCAPWHLLGGVIEWDALGWKDRLSVLRLGRPVKTEQRRLRGATGMMACSPEETVENWLVRNGQTPRLREMLWDPLALAALNQPPREAAAPTFVRVLAEMFGPDPQAASIAPAVPLDAMYARRPAAHRAAAGDGRTPCANCHRDGARGARARRPRDLRVVVSACDCAALDEVPPSLQPRVRRRAHGVLPIVTVNLVRPPGAADASWACWPHHAVGVDRGDQRAPAVARRSAERRAAPWLLDQRRRREHRDARAATPPGAAPAVRRRRRPRAPGHFCGAGQPDARPGPLRVLSGRRLTDTGLPHD